ncbi:sulfotransferase [Gangjinia marincola]|uniref:Sulfotransferase n=1 Tax=Gangjinia marincola TaxID=578463 RepID=A0ABN1MHU7_9FLAO
MKNKIIYLLGAGRSGTTLLASALHTHPNIQTVGELHQFFEYYFDNKSCSCGSVLDACMFWKEIIKEIRFSHVSNENYRSIEKKHNHRYILNYLLSNHNSRDYIKANEEVFSAIRKATSSTWMLDSSKYIARYLLLRKSNKNEIKGVFLVRDVRGVIHSFKKKVQTPRSPFSSLIYYLLINTIGELIARMDKNIIKIRYEDFINNPNKTLERIYEHVFNFKETALLSKEIKTPHFIGGNRLVSKNQIKISQKISWRQEMKRSHQLLYYMLSLPLLIVNKYKM